MRIYLLVLLAMACSARADRPQLPDLKVPDAIGVNIHFTDPRPGEMKMLADAGFKWVRMDFSWDGTEREKGKYDFAAYDRLLAALEPHGIRAYFILDYGNRLYDDGLSPHAEEGRAAMARWAAAAVTHFKGKGIVWEMFNEPNIGFWKPRPDVYDYAKMALEVAKAIRAAAPDELHVGPATSTIDMTFIETCFKAGLLAYWDAVSVHPYRQEDPETVNAEYRKLRLLIAKYAPKGRTIPILSGEWGYSSAWANHDEARQGKYLPREMLTNLYNEVPISIWYDWHEDGTDPKEAEHHFGSVRNAYTKDGLTVYEPKPAYVAMKVLSEQLGGFAYSKRLAVESTDDYVLLFAKGQETRLVAWTRSKQAHEVMLPASAGKFTITDHLGVKRANVDAGEKGIPVMLADSVQYLVPEKPNDLLRVAAAWSRAGIVTSSKWLSPGMEWKNPLNRTITLAGDRPMKADPGESPHYVDDGGPWMGVGVNLHDPQPRRMVDSLTIEGMGRIAQESLLVSTHPLILTILPPVGQTLSVRIENPSGGAFAGVVRLTGLAGIDVAAPTQEVTLKEGDRLTTAEFRLASPAANVWTAGIELDLLPGLRAALTVKPRTYRNVIDLAAKNATALLNVTVDGDAKVKSTQELTSAGAPTPLPGGRIPGALKLTYALDPGWKFLQVKPAPAELRKIDGKPKHLGLWVYGDGLGMQLRLRFTDAIGQTFQPGGIKIDFKGWQYVTIPMDGSESGHWGKGDGTVHYPIAWDSMLLLDNGSRRKVSGEVWFAGMTLVE